MSIERVNVGKKGFILVRRNPVVDAGILLLIVPCRLQIGRCDSAEVIETFAQSGCCGVPGGTRKNIAVA